MKKQELIEKWIEISAAAKAKNEIVCSLNPLDENGKIVANLINSIFNAFIIDLRSIDDTPDHFPDTGKMMPIKGLLVDFNIWLYGNDTVTIRKACEINASEYLKTKEKS